MTILVILWLRGSASTSKLTNNTHLIQTVITNIHRIKLTFDCQDIIVLLLSLIRQLLLPNYNQVVNSLD